MRASAAVGSMTGMPAASASSTNGSVQPGTSAAAPPTGITVQTHHIAKGLADQRFDPAIVDPFMAQTHGGRLHIRSPVPQVPVAVRALQPSGFRSPKVMSAFTSAFRPAIAEQLAGVISRSKAYPATQRGAPPARPRGVEACTGPGRPAW